ncbi:MAG TPA: LamG-like jellyroll fold domain-containing protein [Actinocrinis sp.]|nr:LamG-like jellyroll fold domain-containing protein [Actinocrinis sp.]
MAALLYTPAATLAGQSFIDPYNDENVNPGGTAEGFSIMAWINPVVTAATGYVFSNNPIGRPGCAVSVGTDGLVSFQIGPAAPVVSATPLVLGKWVNVTCTWTAATGAAVIYLDGVQSSTGTMPIGSTSTVGAPLIGAGASTQSALPVSQGLTNYLGQRINNIGLLPQLEALFTNGVSPTAVYQALQVLNAFGLLTGMAKFFWQAVTNSYSIWTVVSLAGRLVLLFSPFAPLEIALFITELSLALVNVYNVWNDPANCWKTAQLANVG